MLLLSSGFPPSQYINANYIPYAVLRIPVTIYQLPICTSLTFHPILLAPQSPLPSVCHQIVHYIVSLLLISLFFSLDSTYKWNHMVFIFFFLTYSTQRNNL